MSNMEKWNLLSKPPKEALKTINAGRLRGKSDINPQWRYKAMTEVYGPCGVGWGWAIERLWTEDAPEGQVMAFAQVRVWTAENPDHTGAIANNIPGIGGSMLVVKESGGLHVNDEGYKMAVTDALGVALKFLGVASSIYEGNFDGAKYIREDKPATPQSEAPKVLEASFRPAPVATPAPPPPPPPPPPPAEEPKEEKKGGRPPITVEWLWDKVDRSMDVDDLKKLWNQYSPKAHKLGVLDDFKARCSARKQVILNDLGGVPPSKVTIDAPELTIPMPSRDELIKNIKQYMMKYRGWTEEEMNAEFSLMDMFFDVKTGTIPYHSESEIPDQALYEWLKQKGEAK